MYRIYSKRKEEEERKNNISNGSRKQDDIPTEKFIVIDSTVLVAQEKHVFKYPERKT